MAYRRFNLTYYSMLICIFPLAIFILSSINKKVHSASSIVNEIISSLNDYPLSEFEYSSNCQDKYYGSIYTFSGTKKGCTCVNVTSYRYRQSGKGEVNPGSCSYNQTRNKCQNISPIESKKLYFWENGKFCSKYYNTSELSLNGYLYFLNSSVLENEECESGYKKCGKLDDMGNYLCLPISEECPINDIKVTYGRSIELEEQNYFYTNLSDKYFYYTNNSEKPIISKLKAAEGKLCMDRTYFYTDYPQYILDNNFNNYGCRHKIDGKLYDSNFEILDTRKKIDIYTDSDFLIKDLYSWNYDFPYFSLEVDMALYPQRYIGFSKKCLNNAGAFNSNKFPFSKENINENDGIIKKALSYNKYVLWFSIVSFILELISCAAINVDSENYWFLIWIWAFVNFLLYFSMSLPLYLNITNITKYNDLPTCGNRITNLKIEFYNSVDETIKITTIISIVFANLQIIFIIGIILIKKYLQFIDVPNDANNQNFIDNYRL